MRTATRSYLTRLIYLSLILISMDNMETYVIYVYCKKIKKTCEVISNEQICQVKISTNTEGEKIKSEYLQIDFKKAIKKKKIRKVFWFHKTVNQAKTFSEGNSAPSIGYHLKNYYSDYVSGAMRIRIRDKKMQLFKSSNNSIISNARCLVEGVDVPTVGMVSFISPKKSEIDIVQAIGRALRNRNDPKKKFGYVHCLFL